MTLTDIANGADMYHVELDEPAQARALALLSKAGAELNTTRGTAHLADLAELLGIDRGAFYDATVAENVRRAELQRTLAAADARQRKFSAVVEASAGSNVAETDV